YGPDPPPRSGSPAEGAGIHRRPQLGPADRLATRGGAIFRSAGDASSPGPDSRCLRISRPRWVDGPGTTARRLAPQPDGHGRPPPGHDVLFEQALDAALR